MANDEYREPQQAAREKGLAQRNVTRQERAIRKQDADHLEKLAEQWIAVGLVLDVGPAEQRGTGAEVFRARENASDLKCWASHLRNADVLLNPPEIGSREATE